MPDTDKILEAEQNIQNIAAELARMRDAAKLLQGAQEQTDAVIDAAQKVVVATDDFSKKCGAIVSKLESTDLSKKLDSIEKFQKNVSEAINNLDNGLRELRNDVQTASATILTAVKAVENQSHSDYVHLVNLVKEKTQALNVKVSNVSEQIISLETAHFKAAKGAMRRSIIIMVFAILGFMLAAGTMAMLLIQRG